MTRREDLEAAAEAFVAVVGQVRPDGWEAPGLGVWTVRDLAGHTSRALLTIESYLQPGTTVAEPDPADAIAYFRAGRAMLADPASVAERGRQAGVALGEDPAVAVGVIARRVLDLVASSPGDALVNTPVRSMRLIDYLPTRVFELVVHTYDLALAVGVDAPAGLGPPTVSCLRLASELAAEGGDGARLLLALTGRRPLPEGFTVL